MQEHPIPSSCYVALDLETTGLDPAMHQVLEFGAVFNDFTKPVRECDTFRCLVNPGENIVGSVFALQMNVKLLRELVDDGGVNLEECLEGFTQWLIVRGIDREHKATLVGKNLGSFDVQFLKDMYSWPEDYIGYRYLDVGSMWATPLGVSGQSELCRELGRKYQLEGDPHTAVYDAQISLALAREKWAREDATWEWLAR